MYLNPLTLAFHCFLPIFSSHEERWFLFVSVPLTLLKSRGYKYTSFEPLHFFIELLYISHVNEIILCLSFLWFTSSIMISFNSIYIAKNRILWLFLTAAKCLIAYIYMPHICDGSAWWKGTLIHHLWKCCLFQPLWKTICRYSSKQIIELPYDPVIPLLCFYHQDTETFIQNNNLL